MSVSDGEITPGQESISFTWSLFFLIYCQREWIIVLLVAVCTPSNRARRTSSLNWDGSWFNMNIIVHFTSRSPTLSIYFYIINNPLHTRSFYLESISFLCVLLSVPLYQVIVRAIKFFVQFDNQWLEKCRELSLGFARSCLGIVSTTIIMKFWLLLGNHDGLTKSNSLKRLPIERFLLKQSSFNTKFPISSWIGLLWISWIVRICNE